MSAVVSFYEEAQRRQVLVEAIATLRPTPAPIDPQLMWLLIVEELTWEEPESWADQRVEQ